MVEKVINRLKWILYDLNSLSSDFVRAEDWTEWERVTTEFINNMLEVIASNLEEEDE